MMQNALSACLVDRDRIAVGTDDGLFCVDLDRDEICRIGDQKKIHQVRCYGSLLKQKNLWEGLQNWFCLGGADIFASPCEKTPCVPDGEGRVSLNKAPRHPHGLPSLRRVFVYVVW